PKLITDAFSLILSYNYDVSVTTPITPAKEVFHFEQVFNGEFVYKFTLPTDFPTCNLSIMLKLTTPQRSSPSPVVKYTIPAHGQQNAPLLDILKVSHINRRLPEKTAILLIEPGEQKPLLHLRGWAEMGQQLDHLERLKVITSV